MFVVAALFSNPANSVSAVVNISGIDPPDGESLKTGRSLLFEVRDELLIHSIRRKTKLVEAKIELEKAEALLESASGHRQTNKPQAYKAGGSASAGGMNDKPKSKPSRVKNNGPINPRYTVLEVFSDADEGLVAVMRDGKQIMHVRVGDLVSKGWRVHKITGAAVHIKKGARSGRIGLSGGR